MARPNWMKKAKGFTFSFLHLLHLRTLLWANFSSCQKGYCHANWSPFIVWEPHPAERWPSGWRRSLGKRIYAKSVTRVRISSSPPLITSEKFWKCPKFSKPQMNVFNKLVISTFGRHHSKTRDIAWFWTKRGHEMDNELIEENCYLKETSVFI